MSSTSIFSRARASGRKLCRCAGPSVALRREPVQQLEALGLAEVEREALLAAVRLLDEEVDAVDLGGDAARAEPALAVAALGVLDLDHVRAPVGQHRARGRHEPELRHLEHAHALHRLMHLASSSGIARSYRARQNSDASSNRAEEPMPRARSPPSSRRLVLRGGGGGARGRRGAARALVRAGAGAVARRGRRATSVRRVLPASRRAPRRRREGRGRGARLPLPRLEVRRRGPLHRHPVRAAHPAEGGAGRVADPAGERPDLRVVRPERRRAALPRCPRCPSGARAELDGARGAELRGEARIRRRWPRTSSTRRTSASCTATPRMPADAGGGRTASMFHAYAGADASRRRRARRSAAWTMTMHGCGLRRSRASRAWSRRC